MKELVARLTSRKFLLALSAFIAAIANNDIQLAVTVVIGYLAAEGTSDAVTAYKAK